MSQRTSSATKVESRHSLSAAQSVKGRLELQSSGCTRHGFSLVEVIIVIVILSLFAGLIIPRVAGISRGTNQLTVMQAEDLLAAFAYRDSIASGKTALEFNGDSRLLMLMSNVSESSGAESNTWSVDTLAPAVYLPESIEISAFRDGSLLPNSGWWIESSSDGTRPKVELNLEGTELDSSITLPRWSQSPYTTDRIQDSFSRVVLPEEIDLDSSGQERIRW